MPLFKTSAINKAILFLVAVMLSVSAMAVDFNETQRRASQGNAFDQAMLGIMYYDGKGVRQDYAKAAQWVEKAANQGDAYAQALIGKMYHDGEGVRQNTAKAVLWYEKAANQEHIVAQLILGTMYGGGIGVQKNIATAKEWYGKACDNGNQDGCDAYKLLNQR